MTHHPRKIAARPGPGRRDVLKAIPLVSVAMCVPNVASAAAAPLPPKTVKPGRDPVYQPTELIRRYYDRARF